MDRDTFTRELEAEGFRETVTVEREPNGGLEIHSHPFEAKALVLQGELVICVDDTPRRYGEGEVFHLHAECPHAETYGPQGVTYLVGRK